MNWAAFFAMGGHAPYVWGVYGIAAIVLGINAIQPLRYRRTLIKRLRNHYRLRSSNR